MGTYCGSLVYYVERKREEQTKQQNRARRRERERKNNNLTEEGELRAGRWDRERVERVREKESSIHFLFSVIQVAL